jgi:hypothetical protein
LRYRNQISLEPLKHGKEILYYSTQAYVFLIRSWIASARFILTVGRDYLK